MTRRIRIEACFPGGLKVEARIGSFVVATDQRREDGGGGSGPNPFELFGASIVTCSGFVIAEFCRARNIELDGIQLALEFEKDPGTGRYPRMTLLLGLPEHFPEKYRSAVVRAMDQCTVKKHILDPPEFEIRLS